MGWLIALGILVLLVILPLGVSGQYDCDGAVLWLVVGPLHIQILPGKKNDPDQKARKKEEKKAKKVQKVTSKSKEAASGKAKKKKGGSVTDFLPIVKTLLECLNSFRKKLRINLLDLTVILAGDDPCDLAVNYGRANAAMGNLLPQLERYFVIKKRNVEVECDFEASQTVVLARATAIISLGWLLVLVARYGVRIVKQYFQIQKSRKGGATK